MTTSTGADLRVILIRHAEKPIPGEAKGVDEAGCANEAGLTPRGWQRAGALVGLFRASQTSGQENWTPDIVYAAGTGPGSESLRSVQTAAPLVSAFAIQLVAKYLKDDIDGLVADLQSRSGCALVIWEHKVMADIAYRLSEGTLSPAPWPQDCYDKIWTFQRLGGTWTWTVQSQHLLAGDSA